MQKEWSQMTPGEKREERFRQFMSTENKEFVSEEAKKAYADRAKRYCQAARLQASDSVPIISPDIALDLAGVTFHTAMYDYAELGRAFLIYIDHVDTDIFTCGMVPSGRVNELLDVKDHVWPGHGLEQDYQGFQFLENEYMKAEEYDEMLQNPNEFAWKKYLPRMMGSFAPMAQLYDLTGCLGNISASAGLMMQINPAIIESFQKLAAATGENMQWIMNMIGVNAQAEKKGFPIMKMTTGGGTAPFDDISNYMRGTKGILTDIFRRPEKVLQAMDLLIDMRVKRMKGGFMAFTQDYPFSHMALHKGGDDFMSDKQFARFYWPPLKKTLLALIDEGYVPFIFAEGYFNRRLEYFTELPKGSVVWWFKYTDMIRAKQILGQHACIAGGMPNPRFILDKPEDIKKRCRELIEACGGDGGFILGCGGYGNIHHGKLENVLAMVQATREYRG